MLPLPEILSDLEADNMTYRLNLIHDPFTFMPRVVMETQDSEGLFIREIPPVLSQLILIALSKAKEVINE